MVEIEENKEGGRHAAEEIPFPSLPPTSSLTKTTFAFLKQRGMNNCFAYDLVPTVDVIEAMIRAARRCNDFPTAVRAIEGVKVKVEKESQYEAYLKELEPIMKELGTFLISLLLHTFCPQVLLFFLRV